MLNVAQKKAVEYLDGPLLVLAGPGTGKTQLLSEKVAYILKNTDTAAENILCLTFTESGASNMRERLKSIVGPAALKVNISTYHVFGQEILAAYKNYSEDYDRRLNEVIDEVRQYKIIQEIQAGLSATDILRGDGVRDIMSVISEAKAAGLSANDLAEIAKQNLADSAVISEAISPLLKNIVPRNYSASLEQAYQPIYEAIKNYNEEIIKLKSEVLVEKSIAILAKSLKNALLEAESAEKITPLTKWKDEFFEKDAKGDYRLKDRVANKKLASLAVVMARYEEFLQENGLYDFDDMIEEAVRVLKNDAGFRLTLAERYQVIMLDEFQDTNPSQFMIIKQLTDYEKPLVMAVGDDDQAIYEFQGALSTNLLDFQKHYSAEVVALTENYRSTQEILDYAHHVIRQAPDRFADKELTAHQPTPLKTQIERREFSSSDSEYAWVASEIAKLVKGGVKQSEIAVISYKTKYFMPLLPYLKAYPELKIAYEKRDNLLEDPAIHEILTIAKYANELAQEKRVDTQLTEILAYPYFNLPAVEVVKLMNAARAGHRSLFDVASACEISTITEVMQWLADVALVALCEPVEVVLEYIMGARKLDGFVSPLLNYYTKEEYAAFSFYENLAALTGKLKRHFGSEKSLKLSDLVEMVQDYEAAEMMIATTSPYRDADEAVQILSAHKAKGLEFEYVFLISVDHMAWGKGKGNNNLLSLPKNLLKIRHTGTTDGEKLRILYVALTRAKSHLTLTNSLHDFNGKTPDRLEYLEEYVEGEKVLAPGLPAGNVTLDYAGGAVTHAEVKKLQNWLTPYVNLTPDMRAIYREKIANWRVSATALTGFIDIVYAGPVEFFKKNLLGVPREPETEALAYGNLVHQTFEKITREGLSDEKALDFFLEALEKYEVESKIKDDLRAKGPANLAIALKEFGEILRQGRAEVDLSPEHLVVNGVPVTGKIDHINIDEGAKTIEIYDFKTSGYHKERWQSHLTLYKYALQLEFYKMLLSNSREYGKYKIEKAHILFVTPDKDGEVYDKVYDYTPEGAAELMNLLKAVYQEVSTLEFMHDPEVFKEPDGGRKLPDIKEFVQLLLDKNK